MQREPAASSTYMTTEEWEKLESIFYGEYMELEMAFYEECFNLVKRICLTCGLKQTVISTAMVYFHKFLIIKKVFDNELEKYLTCTTCVFLASKTCNSLVHLDELLKILADIVNLKDNNFSFEARERALSLEIEILSSFDFELEAPLAYSDLLEMRSYFSFLFKTNSKKFFEICCFFINDSFTLPVCLHYSPLEIALASVNLLSLKMGIQLKSFNKEEWYQTINRPVEFKRVEKLSRLLLKMYPSKKEVKQNCEKYLPSLKLKRGRSEKDQTLLTDESKIIC